MITQKKILIIDNDKIMTKLMETYLKNQGYHVEKAEDAIKALDILKYYQPDVIFIDRIMPKIRGDKLCGMIRAMPQFSETYLVIISATLAEETVNLASIGANCAIIKGPFRIMSEYISEAIYESDLSQPIIPHIKGTASSTPRMITKELLSENRYFHNLLDTISQGILELENNRIVFANNSATQLLRSRKELVIGTFINDLLDCELWNIMGPLISTCDEKPLSDIDNQVIDICGKPVIMQCLKVEKYHNRRIILFTNISESHENRARATTEKYNTMNSPVLSHIQQDLKNTLAAIRSTQQEIADNITQLTPENIKGLAERSLKETEKMEHLVDSLPTCLIDGHQ